MTFDEWFVEWKDTLPFAPDEKHIRRLCDQCWQAAQKEAARQCAAIAESLTVNGCGIKDQVYIALTIEREFGLDK